MGETYVPKKGTPPHSGVSIHDGMFTVPSLYHHTHHYYVFPLPCGSYHLT